MASEAYLIDGMTWSYSRLTTYEQCPYQFYLSYIDPQPKTSGFYTQFGSFVHELLAGYYSGKIPRDRLPAEYIRGFRQAVDAKPPTPEIFASHFQQGLDCMTNPWWPTGKIAGVEKRLSFNVGQYKFVGIVDLLIEENDGLVIVDHKSRDLKPRSKRSKPTQNDITLDNYLRQLYLYAEGVHQVYGTWPIKLAFHCFRTGQFIVENFDKNRLEVTLEWAKSLISRIRDDIFWLSSPEFHLCRNLCNVVRNCEYKDMR